MSVVDISRARAMLPGMESDSNTVHPLYTVKVWRQGSQRVFPLYKALLAALDFDVDNPDELLIIRVHPPFVSFRVAKPERLIPVESWDPAVLPPAWPRPAKSEPTP